MDFKAVIFDLDGTLLNTLEDLAASTNAALSSLGFPEHQIESYKYFVGAGAKNLVKNALPTDVQNDDAIVSRCLAAMRKHYGMHWADYSHPYDGITELLDSLATGNIKMSILSNKPDDFTQLIVEKLLPKWSFEEIRGERSGIPRKPNPTSALEIASAMGLKPQQIVFVGDSGTDMETSKAAQMFAVGVTWGFRNRDELIKFGASKVIDTPLELLDLFAP